MPEAHPSQLRERVVEAYEAGEGSYAEISRRFAVGSASVKRWVRLRRNHGSVAPRRRGGGTPSQIGAIDVALLLARMPDGNAGELTVLFNWGRRANDRIHLSSMKRALRRHGYVVKKSDSGHWNNSALMSTRSDAST